MVARPLHWLTKKGGRAFWCSVECKTTFIQLCEALGKALVIMSPNPAKHFIVDTDTSFYHRSLICSYLCRQKFWLRKDRAAHEVVRGTARI